jgi:phage-related protein
MARAIRPISWIKAAKKNFGYRGDAFRVAYALQLGDELWVIHAFQKKSKKGITTPKPDIDLIKERIHRLKEALK